MIMGMEQGDYFEYGGGSGDYAPAPVSYDIGVDYSSFYGGVGNESEGGDVAPIDWGFDTTSWPTIDQAGDPAPNNSGLMVDPITGFMDMGGGYFYDPVADSFYDFGEGLDDQWRQIYDDWRAFGVDPETAASYADQDYQTMRESAGDVISISQSATELPSPPDLPGGGEYFPLPFVSTYNPWQSPPYVPVFDEGPTPPAPPGPRLPDYCPGGMYHPVDDPYSCVPFPAATTNQQQGPKPPTPQPSAPPKSATPTAKPPAPKRCAPGQYYSQRLKRCVTPPKCGPGFVFDPVLEGCVRVGTQTSPLPATGQGITDLLKNTPPWLWAALLAALVLLNSGGDESKRVTIQHRRAA